MTSLRKYVPDFSLPPTTRTQSESLLAGVTRLGTCKKLTSKYYRSFESLHCRCVRSDSVIPTFQVTNIDITPQVVLLKFQVVVSCDSSDGPNGVQILGI